YEDAARALEGAIELAGDRERKARIEALQGEIRFKQGSIDGSLALYEYALRRLGHRVPRTMLGLGYGILRELVVQCAHSLRPRSLHRKPYSGEHELAVRILFHATNAYAFQNSLKMLWGHLVALNLAELHPPTTGLAITYAGHAGLTSLLGWSGRGA